MMDNRYAFSKVLSVQKRVQSTVDINRTWIESVASKDLFRSFFRCRWEGWNYHTEHYFMTEVSQLMLL